MKFFFKKDTENNESILHQFIYTIFPIDIFIVKDWVWFIILLFILLANIISLGIAYYTTTKFNLIRKGLR